MDKQIVTTTNVKQAVPFFLVSNTGHSSFETVRW
jgi:hypothetical protein